MSYPPAKRQRSNTSQESANNAPPTAAPGLRQPHPQLQENTIPTAALYNAGTAYSNGHGSYSTPSPVRQAIDYGTSYPSNPVTAAQSKAYAGGYQAHPHPHAHSHASMGFGDTYSPQLAIRNHPYASQYQQQSYPTKQDTSSTLQQYAQSAAVNGNHAHAHAHNQNHNHNHAGFARALQSEIIRAYSPTPPAPQTTSHGQPQQQNSFIQYGDTYASQPSTHMSAYRGNSTPYPDPTINPQYSPPPPQPPPPPLQQSPPNGNGQDMEDSEGNDSEDALGEVADDPTEFYPNSNPPNEPSPNISEQPPETKCACKKGRGKKKACSSCQCTKYGRACSLQCACGDACGNPFADLTLFFGPPETFPKLCGANPCFATWLSNQPNIEELDMDLMVDMMLYDDTSWANIRSYTPAFAKWETSWTRARNGKGKKNREERERLEFELLRGGLGNCNQNDFNGFFYSFCRSGWVPTDDWEHCQECRHCKSSMEWHCEKHNQCTTNRICPGCHANAQYPDMMAYAEAGT